LSFFLHQQASHSIRDELCTYEDDLITISV